MSGSVRCSPPIAPWTTGENCSAIPPPSLPCLIVCSTTATCSSAARAVGARRPVRPTPRRMLNETTTKANMEAGQGPAAFAFFDPGLRSEALPKNHVGKTKPSASHCYSQRVRLSRFFGASPIASALDLRSGATPRRRYSNYHVQPSGK